jgi:Skp family chaperone for outer membrane proteins
LRSELPGIPKVEWMSIKDGVKTPVDIEVHHTSEQLLKLHEELAAVHREYEQRVNYFKAKVKNLTTAENARIAKENADNEAEAEKTNADLRNKFNKEMDEYNAEVKKIKLEFEKERQEKIKKAAALRIDVHPRFQKVIDEFLKKLPESQD